MDAMMYILIMSNDINKIVILNVNGVRDYSRKLFWVAIP